MKRFDELYRQSLPNFNSEEWNLLFELCRDLHVNTNVDIHEVISEHIYNKAMTIENAELIAHIQNLESPQLIALAEAIDRYNVLVDEHGHNATVKRIGVQF